VQDLTPATIVTTLMSIAKAIEDTTSEIAELDAVATTARANLKREYARAFLTAEGSNDIRRYTAELNTTELNFQTELAEQVLRSARDTIRMLRDRLEVGRSLSAIMRMEWANNS
jgi:hypothetical protein